MFSPILVSTIRYFSKHFSYSIISISGLVVGITTSILIFLWATYELTFDQYHPDNEKVFTVMLNESIDGEIETYEETPIQLADFLVTEVPEIEMVSRIDYSGAYLTNGDRTARKSGIYADKDYFKIFNAKIIAGDINNMLPNKHSIVLSEEMARILFENGDALGKTVVHNLKTEYKVTGVFAEFPLNSSARGCGKFVLPFDSKKRDYAEDWQTTIVKLNDVHSKSAVEEKINQKLSELFENDLSTSLLFCLTDWRLHWNFENGKSTGGRIVYVVIFCVAALFVLVMACINYMNLATARAAQRAKEIGVRKMTGASRAVLIKQFMYESFTITFIAAAVSLLLAYALLPAFNELTSTPLTLSLENPQLIFGIVVITILAAIMAGSYPALLLSSLKPAMVLKGNLYSSLTGGGLRKTLVVFQFALSIVMVFCALVIWQQIEYLLKNDMGFDRHHVLSIQTPSGPTFAMENFQAELLTHPAILSAGSGDSNPMEINGSTAVDWVGKSDQNKIIMNGASCDDGYLPTLGIEFVQGRNFSKDFAADSSNFVITQKAAELMGFRDPIGQTIMYDMYHNHAGKIIGVIKDFHNDDIHVAMNPVIFSLGKAQNYGRVFVRYAPEKLEDALAHIKSTYKKFEANLPIEYSFLDQEFEQQFYQEKLIRKLSIGFTVIAVLIACLGLFGLTMFSAQRRTKEIGIRKVLGASVTQVMAMLCRDFIRPVLLSFAFAFPLAYYMMHRFLEAYPFRVTISVFTFLTVAIAMVGMVLFTVSYLSYQAAVQNPVTSLKSE